MIKQMKKVCLVCMKDEREAVLSAVQRSELMMITSSENGVQYGGGSGARERRLDALLKELTKRSRKRGLFDSLPEVNADDFEKIDDSAISESSEIEEKLRLSDEVERSLLDNMRALDELRGYSDFKGDLSLLGEREYTVTLLGRVSVRFTEALDLSEIAHETLSTGEKDALVLVTFLKDERAEALEFLRGISFEEITPSVKEGTVAEEIARLESRVKEEKDRKERLAEELSLFAEKSRESLELLFEQYRARADREEIRLGETLETVILEGFVKADDVERLKEAISGVTEVFSLEARDPEENEEVPTSLENPKLVSQFEGITDMFNSPKYGDFDPNAVMAPWYWIIFGMMMGDAGYGLLLALFILIGKKLMKPKGNTLKLMNVMLYSSITTVIFGVLFGSYFGEELFPALIGFTAMDDPVRMLIITIVIGVLHIFTGMITKIVLLVREGRWLDAIFDHLSWMMIILGIGFIFLPSLSTVGIVIAIIGALTVLFTAGRAKKGIMGKVTGGLVGLYGITSYFSDILSYSRILALGLATGVVGMVMNMLAGMIQGSVIGFILSLFIYIIGHVFNLVLGLLSAYVHDCRLQYIEFYSKFYEGGGVPFKPFKIRTNYINIKKD